MQNRWIFLAAAAAIPLVYACSSPSRGGGGRDECEEDNDCDDDEVCEDNKCVDKDGSGSGGGSGSACQTSAECTYPLVCDRWKGECAACRTSADCDAASQCKDSACAPTTACKSDLDCSSGGLLCDTEASRCVECNSAADCGGDKACLGHSCVTVTPCASSLDCAEQHMVCALAAPPAWPAQAGGKACQECGQTADCPERSACKGGLCFEVCEVTGHTCGDVDGVSCGSCPQGECTGAGTSCVVWETSLFGDELRGSVLDADKAYVLSLSFNTFDSAIYSIDRATGMAETLAQASGWISSLTGNSTELFWSVKSDVIRMPKSGGSPSLLATVNGDCLEIKANEEAVFCALEGSGTTKNGLYRLNIGTGSVNNVWTSTLTPKIRLGPDRVYWTVSSTPTTFGYTLFTSTSKETISNADVEDFEATAGFIYQTVTDGDSSSVLRRAHGGDQDEKILQGLVLTTTKDTLYALTLPDRDIVQISDAGALSGPILIGSDFEDVIGPAADEKGLVFGHKATGVEEVRWNP